MKRHIFFTLTCLIMLFASGTTWAQSEAYGRDYSLRTLDPRVAELLVTDLCDEFEKKTDGCRVQVAHGHKLSVFAPKEVHTLIVRMLVDRDLDASGSQSFQIHLVRASSDGGSSPIPGGNIQKALEAVKELFHYKSFEILDQGLIRTTSEAQARLGNPKSGQYRVNLRQRSGVTGLDGAELTVELELVHEIPEGGAMQIMASRLTLKQGETIVAGSSRLATGDGTLLVLLTSLK